MLRAILAFALAAAAGDAPAAIPAAQVVRAAERAYDELHRIEELAGSDASLDALSAAVSRVEQDADRLRSAISATRSVASDQDSEYLGHEVARRQASVNEWDDQLSARVQLLDNALASLRRLAETWRLTAASFGPDAPPSLAARARDVRDRATELERVAGKRLASLLTLQDRVATVKLALSVLLASLASADAERRRELLAVESAPLWRAAAWTLPGGTPTPLRAFATQCRAALAYAASEPLRLAAQLALGAALVAAGLAVARRIRRAPQREPRSLAVEVVATYPVDAAVLMTLFATPLLHPGRPPAVSLLASIAGLIPIIRIAGLLAPVSKGPLRSLAALFVAGRVISFAPQAVPSARIALLLLTIAASGACAAGLRPGGFLHRLDGRGWRAPILAAALVAAVLFGVSAVANVAGNVSLAMFLTEATLASIFAAAAVTVFAIVVSGAFRAMLELPAARRLRIVLEHENILRERVAALLRLAAVAAWVLVTLDAFDAIQPGAALARAVLGLRLKVGGLDLSVGDGVAFGVTLWIAVWISRALKFALDEGVLPSLDVGRGSAAAISTSAKYAVVGIGFGAAILAANVEVTRFTVLAGTLGVGIGFGLQNVVNNFVSGLILLYERPVQVGDVIEIGQLTGEVRRIGVRSSTVRTYQGADVIVPNSNFISAEVVNWTGSDRQRRVDVKLGVSYGTDPGRVCELLLALAKGCAGVAPSPEPIALFTGFGDSALLFELRVWGTVDDWVATASRLRASIHAELSRAGIVFAFPQLDLWVRSTPKPAARARLPAGSVLQGPKDRPARR